MTKIKYYCQSLIQQVEDKEKEVRHFKTKFYSQKHHMMKINMEKQMRNRQEQTDARQENIFAADAV